MTDEKLNCKATMGSANQYRVWPCYNIAKYDGYCGLHEPKRRAKRLAERRRKRGPTKRERAEERQKRLDAVLDAAREMCLPHWPYHGESMDKLREALAEYDRGEK